MRNLLSRLEAIERRLDHTAGPTLTVILKDGTSKAVTVAAAIDLFKDGRAVHAETNTGSNGQLPGLLNALAETE